QFNPASEFTIFSLEKSRFCDALKALFSAALSVLKNPFTNDVRIEESFSHINPGHRGTPYCWSGRLCAAARENSPARNSGRGLRVQRFATSRSISPTAA